MSGCCQNVLRISVAVAVSSSLTLDILDAYEAPLKSASVHVVWLEYDAKNVASESATIEILTPESKTISAMFDLKSLR